MSLARLGAGALLGFLLLPGWGDLVDRLDLRPPLWVERALYNPGDRTADGLEALRAGETDEAVEEMDRALRLAPEDPRVLYNAGAVHLAAERRDAAELAHAAAEAAPPELAPDAFYNLGNAHLAGGDPGRAVSAYEEALRRAPDHADAKFNLEVALAELARQEARFGPSSEAPHGEQPGEEEESDRSSPEGERPPDETPDEEGSPEDGDPQEDSRDPAGEPDRPGSSDRRPEERSHPRELEALLERFAEQPDMTARQAAALLQAVENLERRERAARAAEQAKRQSSTEKDW